jgi:hypothetical protein
MYLSILIATVPTRKKHLNKLLYSLQNQLIKNNLQDKVEVIVYEDNFEKSLGQKRNLLIESSSGKYVVAIDDDDSVSDDYCKDICEIIGNQDVDQISITKRWYENNKSVPIKISKNFGFYSLNFLKFFYLENIIDGDNTPVLNLKINKTILLTSKNFIKSLFLYLIFFLFKKFVTKGLTYTHPMTPIKKEIINKVKFSDRPRDQDVEWITEMCKNNMIKSEYVIDKELYYYFYDKENSIRKDKGEITKNSKELEWSLRDINGINIKWL